MTFEEMMKNSNKGNDQDKPSVRKVWFFDVQWSDCPEFVEEEVILLWRKYKLGNDCYIFKFKVDSADALAYPYINGWLKHKGVKDEELVIIHYWW